MSKAAFKVSNSAAAVILTTARRFAWGLEVAGARAAKEADYPISSTHHTMALASERVGLHLALRSVYDVTAHLPR